MQRILEYLASDDEITREAGTEAAGVLQASATTRVVALAILWPGSVRGPDVGYAGYPTRHQQPCMLSLRRGEPQLTRQIVETQAGAAADEAPPNCPACLVSAAVPGTWDASDTATSEVFAFIVRR
jgi:hypothetical protein